MTISIPVFRIIFSNEKHLLKHFEGTFSLSFFRRQIYSWFLCLTDDDKKQWKKILAFSLFVLLLRQTNWLRHNKTEVELGHQKKFPLPANYVTVQTIFSDSNKNPNPLISVNKQYYPKYNLVLNFNFIICSKYKQGPA